MSTFIFLHSPQTFLWPISIGNVTSIVKNKSFAHQKKKEVSIDVFLYSGIYESKNLYFTLASSSMVNSPGFPRLKGPTCSPSIRRISPSTCANMKFRSLFFIKKKKLKRQFQNSILQNCNCNITKIDHSQFLIPSIQITIFKLLRITQLLFVLITIGPHYY